MQSNQKQCGGTKFLHDLKCRPDDKSSIQSLWVRLYKHLAGDPTDRIAILHSNGTSITCTHGALQLGRLTATTNFSTRHSVMQMEESRNKLFRNFHILLTFQSLPPSELRCCTWGNKRPSGEEFRKSIVQFTQANVQNVSFWINHPI